MGSGVENGGRLFYKERSAFTRSGFERMRSRSAWGREEGIAGWGGVDQFCSGGSCSDPSFGNSKDIRFYVVSEVVECCDV